MPIAGWGFAPALAAGNTVVLKPAELTPLTALRLAELGRRPACPTTCSRCCPARAPWSGSGWSPTSRSARSSSPARPRWGPDPAAGRRPGEARHARARRKSANIVFADADVEKAAANAPAGVFDNAGQDCCARSRILVQRPVYDRFLELLEPAVTGLRSGAARQAGHRDGPADQRGAAGGDPASSSPADAAARVAFRGTASDRPGFWYPPTVVLPRSTDDPVWREEIFGPVVSVLPFDDEADAVALANDTEYGLSGSIWTRDVGRALRVARAVESGNLSVNSNSSVRYSTPFGGFKRSGLGRELGPDALESFTELKNVFISDDDWADDEGRARAALRRPGRRDHRRRRGDRPGHRAAAGVGGRHRGRRSTWTPTPGRRWPTSWAGLFVAADVTSPADNERVYAETHEAYGRIDVAFHNAGSPRRTTTRSSTGLEAGAGSRTST